LPEGFEIGVGLEFGFGGLFEDFRLGFDSLEAGAEAFLIHRHDGEEAGTVSLRVIGGRHEEPNDGGAAEDEGLAPPPFPETGECLGVVGFSFLVGLLGDTGDGELGLDEGTHEWLVLLLGGFFGSLFSGFLFGRFFGGLFCLGSREVGEEVGGGNDDRSVGAATGGGADDFPAGTEEEGGAIGVDGALEGFSLEAGVGAHDALKMESEKVRDVRSFRGLEVDVEIDVPSGSVVVVAFLRERPDLRGDFEGLDGDLGGGVGIEVGLGIDMDFDGPIVEELEW